MVAIAHCDGWSVCRIFAEFDIVCSCLCVSLLFVECLFLFLFFVGFVVLCAMRQTDKTNKITTTIISNKQNQIKNQTCPETKRDENNNNKVVVVFFVLVTVALQGAQGSSTATSKEIRRFELSVSVSARGLTPSAGWRGDEDTQTATQNRNTTHNILQQKGINNNFRDTPKTSERDTQRDTERETSNPGTPQRHKEDPGSLDFIPPHPTNASTQSKTQHRQQQPQRREEKTKQNHRTMSMETLSSSAAPRFNQPPHTHLLTVVSCSNQTNTKPPNQKQFGLWCDI